MSIKTVGIVGCGLMGSGIAQISAENGYQVIVCEQNDSLLQQGINRIHQQWDRQLSKDRLTAEQVTQFKQRLSPTVDLNVLRDADFIIEAITEKMEAKKDLFKQLDAVAKPDVVLATNTSGLSITEIASVVADPGRVIGVHFFNPAPVMKLVELIRGLMTRDDTYETAKQFAVSLGKETIDVKESPLFAVNRILVPMINEAIFVLQEGIASAEDIDKGMVLGANHPIGPLALADLVGLDTLLYVIDSLYEETQDSKYRAAPLLRKMVRAGHLGRKTGRGFYDYTNR